jgi:hypothetical protein
MGDPFPILKMEPFMIPRKFLPLAGAALFLISPVLGNCQITSFTPGQPIHDADGKPIKAYAGGISYFNGTYYWYGEFKNGELRTSELPCYSSTDLLNWKYRGNMVPSMREGELAAFTILERPHVIYNEKTKKYVMWMHLENDNYNRGLTGVLVADSPTGPFSIDGIFHDRGPEGREPDNEDNRDQSIFKDDDGRAYHIFSSHKNHGLVISEMTSDYLRPKGSSIDTGVVCEAPTVFKRNGVYFLLRSDCSGFGFNDNTYATAESMLGKWTDHGVFATGPNSQNTFSTQVTEVVKVRGKQDAYIFVGDRWKEPLYDTFDIFLPIDFTGPRSIEVTWRDRWNIDSAFKK